MSEPSEATTVVLSGNPRPGSRTAGLARTVADRWSGGEAEPIEAADLAASVFAAERSPELVAALDRLRSARRLVVATPSYKGSYTGLLKSLLDHLAAGDLRDAVAVPVVVAAAPAHLVSTAGALTALLGELGATVLPAVTVAESEVDDPAGPLDAWTVRLDRLAGAARNREVVR
ncbi:NADPH-dependent FMN reductase [Naumannella huperziae]